MQSETVRARNESVRQIREALGLPFTIRACDEIITYRIGENEVIVSLIVPQVRETASMMHYQSAITRMLAWKRDAPGAPWKCSKFEVKDEDFKPYTERKFGSGLTPSEYAAKREWEGMQHRVGSERSPMDSASRAAEGHSPMEQYWMKG